MKRILVPCDFSFTARQAYSVAWQIATRTKAEIFVLNVIDLPFAYESAYAVGHYHNDSQLLKDLQKDARKSFDVLRQELGHYEPTHFSAIQGPVSQTIQAFIENEGIDLVVMGTNGANGMKEVFVGSNTEKIVRNSPVPVLAIRQSINLASITNIVVPTDAHEVSTSFISELKGLQTLLMARLHFLMVSIDHRLINSNKMMRRLGDFVSKCGFENYTLNLQREDKTELGITEFTKETNADMIAMATHGRKGLNHLLQGSLAEDIVNHVNCPVWTMSCKKTAEVVEEQEANQNAQA